MNPCMLLSLLGAVSGGEAVPHSTAAALTYAVAPDVTRCPNAATLQDHVKARLGHDPWSTPAQVTFDVAIERRGRGLHAVVQQRSPRGDTLGRREFDSARGDCDALVASIGLSISIALDAFGLAPPPPAGAPPPTSTGGRPQEERPPVRGARAAPPQLTARPRPPAPSAPALQQAPQTARSAARPHALSQALLRWEPHVYADMGAVGALGAQPWPSVGGLMGAGVRVGRLSVGLDARSLLPTPQKSSAGPLALGTVGAGVTGCLHTLYWRSCMVAGPVATTLTGARGAVSQPVALGFNAGARGVLQVPVYRSLVLGVLGQADAHVPRLVLRDAGGSGVLWTAPPVQLWGGVLVGGESP